MINCGQTASAGCVRLTVSDAYWIYNNIVTGTYVEFYSSSDPGPLGKPYSQKISGNEQCRNWDPTDFTEGNPWRNYNVQEEVVEEQEIEEKQEEENKTNENINISDNTITNEDINNKSEEITEEKEDMHDKDIIDNKTLENEITNENIN